MQDVSSFGLIETIKVVNGKMVFQNLHVNRLYRSLGVIHIDESKHEIEAFLVSKVKEECIETEHKDFRFRIEVHKNQMREFSEKEKSLTWHFSSRPLESVPYHWLDAGLSITIFPHATKLLDTFYHLKHTDRSIYENALNYAHKHEADDALVLNENNTVADAAIYNVFIVKDGIVYTPPLTDGPVAGVLREFLLTKVEGLTIQQKSLQVQDIYTADEVFLTNVIRGIRWVRKCDEHHYSYNVTSRIFKAFQKAVIEYFGE